ncbi:hypothetical protein ABID65_003250 [Bradyrhizobium sp. S3.9.2]|uniref:hypothetical protein n=1 Tax=Bradyrhizobium TaxID=374 RepID=UPI000B8EF27E|nr:hypothetical protein [Bradyrhizobium japonicum]
MVKVLSARRTHDSSIICYANVALSDDIAAFNVKITLDKVPGRYRAHAPNSAGGRVVTFSANLAHEIAEAAIQYLEGASANERTA